ncbi:MAG TPA: AsmA family protein [Gammaproteobacteria bacterium]|nr:AsmA family protein [Gammaproteobacteria bacterium]
MARMLKVIGIVVGAVVLLLVAALFAIGLLFDPNDYKDDITAAVARATGRELTLDGDLELRLFPTVRIAVGSAALSNAPGFGDQPFARIGSAGLQLAILPLLSGNIAIGEARLQGLELNLARDARGRNNWQDLGSAGGEAAAEPAPSDAGEPSFDLDVGAVEIADARVTWADAATGTSWELDNFNLEASDLGSGMRFPVTLDFSLSGEEVQVMVDATAEATLVLADNDYRLDDLQVNLAGSGPGWPGGEGEAALGFDSLVASLNDETVELSGLTLELLGMTVTGSFSGQRLLSDLTLSGAVDIQEFDPRDSLAAFDVELTTADPDVLARASAKANLLYTSSQVGLRDMRLVLDDSTLTGRVGLEGETLRFNLAVDAIDIDRYLPPATDGPAEEGSLDEVDLPLEVLRSLNASGELTFGQAKFSGLTLTDAAFALTGANGRLQLTPRASLYGGSSSGDIRVDVQNDAVNVVLEQQLTDVDLAPLGRDLLESEAVSGTGDVILRLTVSGSNLGQMRRDLDGDVAFTVTDGALEGLDLWYELRRARARLDGADVPERGDDPRRTPFSSLSASGVVQDALLTSRDLSATLDFMTIGGVGTVNLLDDAVNFDLTASFVDGPKLQSDPEMVKLAGAAVPLKVTGTLAEPSILPDFGALVRARATEAVQERVEEQRGEVQERVEEQREEVQDRVRDRLRGLLDEQDQQDEPEAESEAPAAPEPQ